MRAVASSPNFKDIETFHKRHEKSLDYVTRLKDTCITKLGISETTIEATERSVELDASENYYMDSLTIRQEDALLGFAVCFW
jgi:thiaminase